MYFKSYPTITLFINIITKKYDIAFYIFTGENFSFLYPQDAQILASNIIVSQRYERLTLLKEQFQYCLCILFFSKQRESSNLVLSPFLSITKFLSCEKIFYIEFKSYKNLFSLNIYI